jgi:SHS2 domain-containing protein
MFETFEHTTDLGLRVRAADLNDLFAEAGRGLFSIVVENPTEIRPQSTRSVELKADSLEQLFFDWLAELLYLFDAQQFVLCTFAVELAGASLVAKVSGEASDRARHRLLRKVKAITRHGLVVRPSGRHWEAEVIVDI